MANGLYKSCSNLCNVVDFLLHFTLWLRQTLLPSSELLVHLRETFRLDAVADIVIQLTQLVLLQLVLQT